MASYPPPLPQQGQLPQQGMQPQGMPQQQPQMPMPPPQQPQMQQPMQAPAPDPDQDDDQENTENLIDYALSSMNIAKKLQKKADKNYVSILDKIGREIHEGYCRDEDSRRVWLKRNEEWLKLAMLVRHDKSYPWPKASNVKYPLLSTAAMQFSARAFPALVPSDGQVVKARVVPYDPDGSISDRAERIAKHMSYQVMCLMPHWEEDMDKLLMTMSITGVCFKKTYHDNTMGVHRSHIVYPENLCVNYWAKNLEKAYRKTEILHYSQNEYQEKVNAGDFLDIDLKPSQAVQTSPEVTHKTVSETRAVQADKSTPHTFLACHTFYDLDDDGYEEPYVITIHEKTKKVVRIIARFDKDGVYKNDKGEIEKIEPIEYFTDFPFIPNPDGSVYAVGFGLLLGPLNESVNTIINQLIDAGTLSNLQSGFIGKGLRLQMKQSIFQPGEWKAVNATGDDLNKQIVPLPTKEPSGVLLELLNMLITSGNQLASIAEIFVGKMPGQNTPATTTQETVKQGMAVFTAIYKRVYRSLHKEFCKIYRLNRIIPGIAQEESQSLGIQIAGTDYTDDHLIVPGGDPTGDSISVKQAKITQVGQMFLPLGTINPVEYTTWGMKELEVPNYQKLIMQPQPQQDPKVQTEQMKQQTMQQKAQIDQQSKQQDMQIKAAMAQLDAQMKQLELQFEQTKQAMELQGAKMKIQLDTVSQVNQQQLDQQKMQHDLLMQKAKSDLDLEHQKSMQQTKLQQQKEQPKKKPKGE